MIVTDDQRPDTLDVMGAVSEWFGAEGVTYSRAIATTPICCPSRASIFTGKYSHNHRVEANNDAHDLRHRPTIQRRLRDTGYLTAYTGRFLNRWPLEKAPPHFDRWATFHPAYFDPRANVDGEVKDLEGYSTNLIEQHAAGFLADFEQDDETPWFLMVTPFAPHDPARPEPKYADAPVPEWSPNPAVGETDLSDKPPHLRRAQFTADEAALLRADRLRTLMSVDDLVDALFTQVEAMGELTNTLAIYTSDNGYLLAEHGMRGKGKPYRLSVRVPMLLRWPNHVSAGTTDARLAANIDIAPTVLEAAGLAVPKRVDGRSLLGKERPRILTERLSGRDQWAALVTKRFQYVEWYRRGRRGVAFREYYDLRKDPWQLKNLFADGRPRNDPPKRKLHLRLAELRVCVGTSGRRPCP